MTKKDNQIQFKQSDVNLLVPYEKNSRIHGDEQINKVAKSIQEFGFINPVIIDSDNGIIAGHCRVIAAKRVGIKHVPTVLVDHLTDKQKKAFIIADNRLAMDSEWNEVLLADEISELMNDEINIDAIGFNEDELEKILGGKEELTEKKEELKPIKKTRILISIPVGNVPDDIEDFLKKVIDAGGEVDYGGN